MAVIVGVAALAVATPGAAAPTHRCAPSEPAFTSLIASTTVSCTEARALNRYMTTHETLSGGFRLHGTTWRGRVYTRAGGQTAMVYRHGRQRIWLSYGAAAS